MITSVLVLVLAVVLERLLFAAMPIFGVVPALGVATFALLSRTLSVSESLLLAGLGAYMADVLAPGPSGLVFLAFAFAAVVVLLPRSALRPGQPIERVRANYHFLVSAGCALLLYTIVPLLPVRGLLHVGQVLQFIVYTLLAGIGVLLMGWWATQRWNHEA